MGCTKHEARGSQVEAECFNGVRIFRVIPQRGNMPAFGAKSRSAPSLVIRGDESTEQAGVYVISD